MNAALPPVSPLPARRFRQVRQVHGKHLVTFLSTDLGTRWAKSRWLALELETTGFAVRPLPDTAGERRRSEGNRITE